MTNQLIIEQIDNILTQAWYEKYYDTEKSQKLIDNALVLSNDNFYNKGIVYCTLYQNILDFILSKENNNILANLLECLNYFENEKTEKGYVISLYSIGNVFDSIGEYYKGIDYCLKAVKYSFENNYDEGLADSFSIIGIIYSRIGDYKSSLESYEKSLKIREQLTDKKAIASILNRLAFTYTLSKDYEKALEYYGKSTEIREEINDFGGLSWSFIGFANLYEQKKNLEPALEYYFKSLELNKIVKDKRCELHCNKGIGRIYNVMQNYEKTKEYLDKAFEIAKSLNAKPLLYELHKAFSEYYENIGNFEKSLYHYKNFQIIKESVLNTELQNKLKHQQISFEIEASKKEAEIYQLKNVVLKEAFDKIERKNKEITSSIEYAKRIQLALLPPGDYLNNIIPERFILFMPKDIVSGDFYWINAKDNQIIIVAADCTGHGVPGAFMSMLGISLLNEIVNKQKVLIASDILNELRLDVIKSLRQKGKFGEPQDGLDISLCILDLTTNIMQFAAANNPLYLFRNNNLLIYKADKMPIGIHILKDIPFANNFIQLEKEDIFYLFSDGYMDQFGGEKERKFMRKNFKELLINIKDEELNVQKKILEETFYSWKGKLDQIDDVLIIGVRI